MTRKRQFRIAVTELAHFCCRTGSVNLANENASGRTPTPQQGQEGQQFIQQQRPENYQREVSVQQTYTTPRCQWLLAGRIDGLLLTPAGSAHNPLLEEIKTTYCREQELPQERHQVHLAQAKLYAALICDQYNIAAIQLVITYLQLDDNTEYQKLSDHLATELTEFLLDCTQQYSDWLDAYCQFLEQRNLYLAEQNFPFSQYRQGQRQLSVTLYRDLRDRQRGFYHAPTGLGKTIATLFPALRHLAEGTIDQIWYLTAKNSGHDSVQQALTHFSDIPALRVLYLQAKEKTCAQCLQATSPENLQTGNCPAQTDYYDRLPEARRRFQVQTHFQRPQLQALAEEFQLCPHQLTRDLLPWTDLVVADYNYVFDPYSRLHDALSNSKHITLLVDEAHNLPDRARAMFSAELTLHCLRQLQTNVTEPALTSALKTLQRQFRRLHQQYDGKPNESAQQLPAIMIRTLQQTSEQLMEWMGQQRWLLFPTDVFELVMQLWRFAQRAQKPAEEDVVLCSSQPQRIHIYCTDPAPRLEQICGEFHSCHFFSGSLLPLTFFKRSIGLSPASELILDSPFPTRNQCTLVAPVNTRYEQRAHSLPQIHNLIATLWQLRPGRYLLAAPSYEYLDGIMTSLATIKQLPLLQQPPNQSTEQRQQFMAALQSDAYLAGVIAGGLFAEGIDLQERRLDGVIVVGTCLPPPAQEREMIRHHFADDNDQGFDFAYRYPGINRVIQTAGRLIRSEFDRGLVLLLDDRFTQTRYRNLLPGHWRPILIKSSSELEQALTQFNAN